MRLTFLWKDLVFARGRLGEREIVTLLLKYDAGILATLTLGEGRCGITASLDSGLDDTLFGGIDLSGR